MTVTQNDGEVTIGNEYLSRTFKTDGKRVIFDMAPYMHTNAEDGVESTWDIDMVVEMKDADHFMRKYLLIKAADDVALNTPIDYIEMENLGTQDMASTDKWTRSQTSGGVGGMTAYTITLGQPVYIDGMFFGSEFLQAENEIDDDNMCHTRYYSGKSLKTLGNNEHRLNATDSSRPGATSSASPARWTSSSPTVTTATMSLSTTSSCSSRKPISSTTIPYTARPTAWPPTP